jgi:hypothetical protein
MTPQDAPLTEWDKAMEPLNTDEKFELMQKSVRAVASAAQSLNCDPLELAEALADGGIGELMDALAALTESCTPARLPSERRDYGVRMPERTGVVLECCVENARATLARLPGRKG